MLRDQCDHFRRIFRQAFFILEVAVIERKHVLVEVHERDFSTGRPRGFDDGVEQFAIERFTSGTAGERQDTRRNGHRGSESISGPSASGAATILNSAEGVTTDGH